MCQVVSSAFTSAPSYRRMEGSTVHVPGNIISSIIPEDGGVYMCQVIASASTSAPLYRRMEGSTCARYYHQLHHTGGWRGLHVQGNCISLHISSIIPEDGGVYIYMCQVISSALSYRRMEGSTCIMWVMMTSR